MSGNTVRKVSMRDIAAGKLPEILSTQQGQRLIKSATTGDVEAVRKLLKMPSVDVNQADSYGNTALIWAASNGKVEVVKLIMDKLGYDIEITN